MSSPHPNPPPQAGEGTKTSLKSPPLCTHGGGLGWGRFALIALIKLYQLLLSPFLGGRCRFYPSCSSYAVESLQKHGTVKGASLICKRVIKCHPWHKGGIDLVP